MRLSFASCTLQPPLLQTSPSPWPSAFPLPLHPLDEEGGPIKRHIAIQMKTSYISVGLSLLSKGLRGGKERSDRVERRPFVSQYPYVYDVIRILFGDFSTNVSGDRIMAWMIGKRDSFDWYHRVKTRCYRERTLAIKAHIDLNWAGLKTSLNTLNLIKYHTCSCTLPHTTLRSDTRPDSTNKMQHHIYLLTSP